MAFSATKFNKDNKFTFKTPEDFTFETLDSLYDKNGEKKIYMVRALYLNTKSRYGVHPVIVTDNELVDIPKHTTETIREMIADDDCVEAINNKKVGFTIYSYIDNKYKKLCYSVRWVDIQ